MSRMLIRVDAELSDELTSAFPHLQARTHSPQSTLSGEVADLEELQGVLSLLRALGIGVLDVVTIPD